MWLCSCLWSSKAPAFLAAFLACAGLSLRRQGAHLPPERRFLPPEGRLYPYPMLEELCHDRKPTSTYSSFTPRSSTPLFYFTLWFKAARYVRCCCCMGSDLLLQEPAQKGRAAAASSGSFCIAGHRRGRGPQSGGGGAPPDWHGQHGREGSRVGPHTFRLLSKKWMRSEGDGTSSMLHLGARRTRKTSCFA